MISQSAQVVLTVPSFLAKLWDMVNDQSLNDIISWTKPGNSFVIRDKGKFALQVLPRYFKHSNLSSFIRQLNKYGFKKVQPFTNKNELEFAHDYFIIDDPEMLLMIKRKQSESKTCEPIESDDIQLKRLLQKAKSLKKAQNVFESKLELVEKESNELWTETVQLKRKQRIQQQIINNIMSFLLNVISQNEKDINISFPFSKNNTIRNNNLIAIAENAHSPEINPFPVKNVIDIGDDAELNSEVMTSSVDKNETEMYDPVSPSITNLLFSESGSNTSDNLCVNDSVLSDINDVTPILNMSDLQLSNEPLVQTTNPNEISVLDPATTKTNFGSDSFDNLTSDVSKSAENDLLLNFNIPLQTFDKIEEADLKGFEMPVECVELEDQNLTEVSHQTFENGKILFEVPNKSSNEDLGDHINITESNLNTLKELLSDADLNLDINEVDDLFLTDEIVSLIANENDPSIAIPLEGFDNKTLSSHDGIICLENSDSFSPTEVPE